jgi:hypothetical protein
MAAPGMRRPAPQLLDEGMMGNSRCCGTRTSTAAPVT